MKVLTLALTVLVTVTFLGCENPYEFEKLCPGQTHLSAAEISKLVTAIEEAEHTLCISTNGGVPLWGEDKNRYDGERAPFFCVTTQEKLEVDPPLCNRKLLKSMACPNTKKGYCRLE